MAKRKAISKRVRFNIFKRDRFTCQYCGAHPPGVLLHIDHIHPVAEGGTNDDDNLITACEPCNLGKGAGLLTDIPQTLAEKAARVREREEQIQGYNAAIRAQADRIEDEAWEIARTLTHDNGLSSFDRADFLSIKQFLSKLGYWPTHEAAEIAACKFSYYGRKTFSYFCGICWNKVREASGG